MPTVAPATDAARARTALTTTACWRDPAHAVNTHGFNRARWAKITQVRSARTLPMLMPVVVAVGEGQTQRPKGVALMRSLQLRFARISIPQGPLAMCAAAAFMIGCGTGEEDPSVSITQGASVRTPQTPLDGNAVPKFVDQLPLSGTRINGSATLNITMQEFQQRVLPASVYAGKPAPFNNGTFLWGYNVNGSGARSPARAIEVFRGTATTAQYTNNLTNTRLQS